MAWRIVKQPNGKYARFSEVVDDFTHYDMTREQALELCQEYLGRADSETKVANADNASDRFTEALDIIQTIHGEPTMLERRAELEG